MLSRSGLLKETRHVRTPAFCGAGQRCCIQIGGVSIALETDEPGLRLGVAGVIEPFVVPENGEADLRLRASRRDLSAEADAGPPLFDSGAVWKLYRRGDACRFRFDARGWTEAPYKVADLAADRRGEVALHAPYFPGEAPLYPLAHPLDELLFVHLLASGRRGIEVHACGVIDADGGALLFAGQSGDGKSTTARLWQREAPAARVLSDDRIILREEAGTIWAYGTPWHGDAGVALPERAPLRRIYFLRHGSENRLRALEKAEAAALLLARSFLPFYSKEGMSESLAVAERIAAQVPAQMFEFVPDGRAVAFVRQQGTA